EVADVLGELLRDRGVLEEHAGVARVGTAVAREEGAQERRDAPALRSEEGARDALVRGLLGAGEPGEPDRGPVPLLLAAAALLVDEVVAETPGPRDLAAERV